MFPGASPLPPYFTFLQARLTMLRDDWARKTTPGSPFLGSLNLLANALRGSTCLLALAVLSSLVPLHTPYIVPALQVLATLQLLCATAHAALGRWAHHKTTARTMLSLTIILAYGLITLLAQKAVQLAYPADARVELLLYVLRYQGWHVALDIADIRPHSDQHACVPRPFLLVSF